MDGELLLASTTTLKLQVKPQVWTFPMVLMMYSAAWDTQISGSVPTDPGENTTVRTQKLLESDVEVKLLDDYMA